MKTSERRKKILEIFEEKKQLSYNEILDLMSECADTVNILNDIDTLVFFKFLQHTPPGQKKLGLETLLELRPHPRTKTLPKIKGNPKIVSRLKELDKELPPWYRKWAVLTVITREMDTEEISQKAKTQYPGIKWSSVLIKAVLKILEEKKFIRAQKKENTIYYTRNSRGKTFLKTPLIQQFFTLKKLKDGFTNEFRTCEILRLVKIHKGVSSGDIVRHLRSEYGIRGNKRRAVKNTLNNMVFSGLLKEIGKTEKRGGHTYCIGEAAEFLFSKIEVEIVHHGIQPFKKSVIQFFEEFNPKKDTTLNIEEVLEDLEQCKEDLSQKSPELWALHISKLSQYIHGSETMWEKKMVQCIAACILSRLLPPEPAVNILKDYPVPNPVSEEGYIYYNGVAGEYYFNLTEGYLVLEDHENTFHSFDCLTLLTWKSPDYYVLKGRVEALKRDIRKRDEFQHVITPFEKALNILEEKDRIGALFYTGLVQYQRGDLKKAVEVWEECLGWVDSIYWKITLYHNLAEAYWLSGELEKAQKYYTASANFTVPPPEMDDPYDAATFYRVRAQSLLGIANVLIDSCSWEEAEEKLRELIAESTENNADTVAAIAKTNLGDLLTRKKQHEKALVCHQEALELVDEESTPREYGIILINMGNTLRLLGKINEALDAFKKARTLISEEHSMLIQALTICEADAYCDTGNFKKSWDLTHTVLQEAWIGTSRPQGDAYRIRGKVHLHKKDFSEAKKALKKSEKIFKELDLQYELLEVYELLEKCSEILKNGEKVQYKTERETLQKQLGLF